MDGPPDALEKYERMDIRGILKDPRSRALSLLDWLMTSAPPVITPTSRRHVFRAYLSTLLGGVTVYNGESDENRIAMSLPVEIGSVLACSAILGSISLLSIIIQPEFCSAIVFASALLIYGAAEMVGFMLKRKNHNFPPFPSAPSFFVPILTSLHAGFVAYAFSPGLLEKSFPSHVSVVLCVVAWLFVYPLASHSAMRGAPDPSMWAHVSTPVHQRLTRSLHCIASSSMVIVAILFQVHAALVVFAIAMHILLPLGWALGLVPPPLVALETFIERVHVSLIGGSPSTSLFYTIMSTATAIIPIAASVAVSFISLHVSIVLSAVFAVIHARGLPIALSRRCGASTRKLVVHSCLDVAFIAMSLLVYSTTVYFASVRSFM